MSLGQVWGTTSSQRHRNVKDIKPRPHIYAAYTDFILLTICCDTNMNLGDIGTQYFKLIEYSNSQAVCLITSLEADYGWTDLEGGEWIYDPTKPFLQSLPTLGAYFDRNLKSCIEHDRRQISDTLFFNGDPSKNITDPIVRKALEEMTWPADGSDSRGSASFVSRFLPEDEFIVGSRWSSGYHMGGGMIGTAGHCIAGPFSRGEVHKLKVVFGWSGNVQGKRFTANQIFDIDKWVLLLCFPRWLMMGFLLRVLLCEMPIPYQDETDYDDIAKWARHWDNAVFTLKGTAEQFQGLEKVELASQPPRFGSSVYNAGHPLGTPMKISHRSHVLRHALFNRQVISQSMLSKVSKRLGTVYHARTPTIALS